jgi:hypothetical protein
VFKQFSHIISPESIIAKLLLDNKPASPSIAADDRVGCLIIFSRMLPYVSEEGKMNGGYKDKA